ncbi:hypothetical protein TNCV_2377051 [Trichonephila clavipes]|nr:hypothetical protein TNCV_2377051 [Trichonephila clavipes]
MQPKAKPSSLRAQAQLSETQTETVETFELVKVERELLREAERTRETVLSEWTKTAPLKMSSMPNQLAHGEKAGQIENGLMA